MVLRIFVLVLSLLVAALIALRDALRIEGTAGLTVVLVGLLGIYGGLIVWGLLRRDRVTELKAELHAELARFLRELEVAHDAYCQKWNSTKQDFTSRGLSNTTGCATAIARDYLSYAQTVEATWFAQVEDKSTTLAALLGNGKQKALGNELYAEYQEAEERKASLLHSDFSDTAQHLDGALGEFASAFRKAVLREPPELQD